MAPTPSLWRREPVLVSALIGGIVAALATALTMIGSGVDLPTAVGAALAELGVILGAGKVAQTQAWAPATVQRKVAQVVAETRMRPLRGRTEHGADPPADIGPFGRGGKATVPTSTGRFRRPPPVVGPGLEGPV